MSLSSIERSAARRAKLSNKKEFCRASFSNFEIMIPKTNPRLIPQNRGRKAESNNPHQCVGAEDRYSRLRKTDIIIYLNGLIHGPKQLMQIIDELQPIGSQCQPWHCGGFEIKTVTSTPAFVQRVDRATVARNPHSNRTSSVR